MSTTDNEIETIAYKNTKKTNKITLNDYKMRLIGIADTLEITKEHVERIG